MSAEKNEPSEANAHTFATCIDLPGEAVQCWKSNVTSVKVVLRKHRDVIFNIQIKTGAVYTLEAAYGDFYDARAKKLVPKGSRISFHDGEIMHVWVSREFKGSLMLKSKNNVLGHYEPNVLDSVQHGSDPTIKPPPLIVTIGINSQPIHSAVTIPQSNQGRRPVPIATNAGAGLGSEATQNQTMHIVELKQSETNVPKEIADFIKHGGEQTALDTTGLLTRNWLFGQIIGMGAYYNDNEPWIKELWREKFYLQKVVHKKVGAKWYIVLSGNPRLRTIFTAARYGSANTKLLTITSGFGSANGLRHATWSGIKGGFQKAGLLAVFATITLDVAEWLADYEQRDPVSGKPKKDFFDLAFKIGLDLAKVGISAVIATALMAGVIAFAAVAGTAALPVAAVIIGTIALSIGVGLLIDYVDKKTGASDKLNFAIRTTAEHLTVSAPKDYKNYQDAMTSPFAQHAFGM
jgi:hypothetical protein